MITEAFLIKFLTALCMQLAENDPFPVRSVYAAISWQDATLPRMIAVFGRLPSAAIGDERHESSVTEIQHETGLVPEVVAKAHLLNSSRFPTYASLNKPIMKALSIPPMAVGCVPNAGSRSRHVSARPLPRHCRQVMA
jgi:hypothetical protein